MFEAPNVEYFGLSTGPYALIMITIQSYLHLLEKITRLRNRLRNYEKTMISRVIDTETEVAQSTIKSK